MAPDAPPPRYDAHGHEVRPWQVTLTYDATVDVVRLTFSQRGDTWHRGQALALTYPPAEWEDAIAQVRRLVSTAVARRLF